jgi:hypothetical protein
MKNETVHFFDIPKHIKDLVFDGDQTDLRLHLEDMFTWSHTTEKGYKAIENKINKFCVKGKGFTVYMWYDISGYNYWRVRMEENNYLQISVLFESERIEVSELKNIEKALARAKTFAEKIEYRCIGHIL